MNNTNTTTVSDIDIRDFNEGETYYAILDESRGGRCVLRGMFIAAWRDKKSAKEAAAKMGEGFVAVKSLKR